jgi:hypothetical protein
VTLPHATRHLAGHVEVEYEGQPPQYDESERAATDSPVAIGPLLVRVRGCPLGFVVIPRNPPNTINTCYDLLQFARFAERVDCVLTSFCTRGFE